MLAPSIQACGPRVTSAKPLRRSWVDALGVHTLLGMPAPWVRKLGFARQRPRRAPGNRPNPGVQDKPGYAMCWGWVLVWVQVPLRGAGSSRWEPSSRPCTSPLLASQRLLPFGETCSQPVFGGSLMWPLKKKKYSPSAKGRTVPLLFKEGQRSPAVRLNGMDESWALVMLYLMNLSSQPQSNHLHTSSLNHCLCGLVIYSISLTELLRSWA